MEITIDQIIQRIEAAKKELDSTREALALIYSGDALALVKNRIQLKRLDADGNILGQYSDAKVPYWFYYNKATLGNSRKKVNDLYKKHGYFASYWDWKRINNQSNRNINLTFTGRMMNSLRPVIVGRRRNAITVTWAARGQDEQEKFEYSVDRFERAFELSDQEANLLERLNQKRVQDIINKITR